MKKIMKNQTKSESRTGLTLYLPEGLRLRLKEYSANQQRSANNMMKIILQDFFDKIDQENKEKSGKNKTLDILND